MGRSRIVALSTEIGRGHPSYLDSVVRLLKENGMDPSWSTVCQESSGFSLLGWRLVALLYSLGGKGGLLTRIYNLVREETKVWTDSLPMRVLGRDLKRGLEHRGELLLVAHPLVAHVLCSVCRTWYIHGEIAAPQECAVRGVEKLFVPLEETRTGLIAQGGDAGSMVVTGLMIEPDLVAGRDEAFSRRLDRIDSGTSVTVGFFSSGAYPSGHMVKIVSGVKSVLDQHMRAVIFCGTNRRVFESLRRRVKRWGLTLAEDTDEETNDRGDWRVRLVTRMTRQEETRRACKLVPTLDAFVAASHERTNWAVGLGLPMFALFPLIGTFAAQNFRFALRQGVVCPLATVEAARDLGRIINELRGGGRLAHMARRGFGRLPVDGVEAVVSQVIAL